MLKIILASLVAIGLASCSTTRLEIAHAALDCVPQPETSLSDRLTDNELNSFSDEVFQSLELHMISYRERINTQCELIIKHNAAHSK